VTKRIRPSPSSSAAVTRRIAVLGGARGLVSVLRAARDDTAELAVIVTIADNRGSSRRLRGQGAGPAVGDLRHSLEALTADDVASGRPSSGR
jgi:2-phospho-L-lactate transferase/gluconeogenesis factor (CofD/UPF0052 family)